VFCLGIAHLQSTNLYWKCKRTVVQKPYLNNENHDFRGNKSSYDNKTFSLTNSIIFRKLKNWDIGAFPDFDIMRNYVGDYISTEINLIGDFIKLCCDYDITSITLNSPYQILSD
jgi:hypothetical protein